MNIFTTALLALLGTGFWPNRATAADTNGCSLGIGVDDGWNGVVVGLPGLAEDIRCDNLSLVLPDMGQHPDSGDVADGPQSLGDAQVAVDRYSMSVCVDTHGIQSDPLHSRTPARGDE